METISLIPVRYAETDKMGVVHHSHYPVYFEQGRSDFFVEHLRPYAEFEAAGILAPVLSLEMEILGRASYGDTLRLHTRPDWLRGVRLQMSYQIFQAEGREVARGRTLHGLVNQQLEAIHPRRMGSCYQELHKVFASQR